ncbi:hypothetical protein [Streptomyces rapamycinicus]|uniref:Uncharacterized protein n=2 Tax=Streptomyces rapamycinicus TaxID=1226757 RepID=A0A3L8QWI5_STRRN|nr:hypothetical protein [Streptomyces rapamycinicus]MBB4787325.1 hypothetical protein [Streptomyces rapamycinicus]RLV71671.1 hypothetical protein D3C57_144130 [Streptomyces rapamycinicus NRRL 5491]UTP36930.1 hypothetical protein LIV37_51680 [Streptomyces rapamycinicus NRRL 5491]
MNAKKINGSWYAQGLIQSWNGAQCDMVLERSHNGSAYNIISGQHVVTNGADHTGYYWDHTGYKSRVCIANASAGDTTWHCGKGIWPKRTPASTAPDAWRLSDPENNQPGRCASGRAPAEGSTAISEQGPGSSRRGDRRIQTRSTPTQTNHRSLKPIRRKLCP